MLLRILLTKAPLLLATFIGPYLGAAQKAEVLRKGTYEKEECLTLGDLAGYTQEVQNKVGLYGGWRHQRLEGTGFFRVEKKTAGGGRSIQRDTPCSPSGSTRLAQRTEDRKVRQTGTRSPGRREPQDAFENMALTPLGPGPLQM